MSGNNVNFRNLITAELARSGYTPRRSKELARDLDISEGDYREFRDTIKQMEREGAVVRVRGGRWGLPDAGKSIVGRLQIARAGYGFLIPDNTALDDVFIPEQYLGAALCGDRVRVMVEPGRGRDYRRSGRVQEVQERASPRIVATITSEMKARPEDPKNPFDYVIEDLEHQIAPDRKVLLEIIRWPGEGGEPSGRILDVLGPAGEPGTETAAILASYDAPDVFSDSVKNEVRNLQRELSAARRSVRLDLTDLVTVTIDPDSARDFDDALSFQEIADGGCVVGVHIADVSHFVRPDSCLDKEARERSTSIYLPERVIPMLPEELSNDLCSLRPDEEHLTKTVFLHYDAQGRRTNYTIHRSIIRSRRRFTYGEVRAILDADAGNNKLPDKNRNTRTPGAGEPEEILATLHGLAGVARKLRAARLEAGSIELNMPEFLVVVDDQGRACRIEQVEHDFSHQLVEEFMLEANVALAEWCAANGMPVLYRIHEPPTEEEFEELAEFLSACGHPFKRPYKRQWLNNIIARVHGKPEEHTINLAILKSFKQAVYGPAHDIGHFALNFSHYMHFTSPIRRYPDLHLHQMLDTVFGDKAHKLPKKLRKFPPRQGKALESLGTHTSGRERRAMKIEEAVKDFRRLEFLSLQDQREFKAVVTGIRKFGIFVEIEDYFVEGMIPRPMLERAGYSTREERPGKAGARARRHQRPGFHLGQEVRVRVTNIDLAARICEMEILKG